MEKGILSKKINELKQHLSNEVNLITNYRLKVIYFVALMIVTTRSIEICTLSIKINYLMISKYRY